MTRPRRRPHVVGVVVLPDAPLFEIAVVCEVFGIPRADLLAPGYELRLCRVTDGVVRVDVPFVLDSRFGPDDLARCDTVIVPALASFDADIPPALIVALLTAAKRKARIVSICTGAFALGAAGLLDGRRATTHWMYTEALAARHPAAVVEPDVLYIADGPVLTSAGTAAGLDLCIEIVRRDYGTAIANDLARRLVISPHRDGGQAQYVRHAVAPEHITLAPLLDWIRDNLASELTLSKLARHTNTSTRTLSRRFTADLGMTPMQWLTTERVRHAQELLEQTTHSIEHVATLSGFGSASNLRMHFKRATTTTPDTYRRHFSERAFVPTRR